MKTKIIKNITLLDGHEEDEGEGDRPGNSGVSSRTTKW